MGTAETWAFTPPQPGAAACKAAWDGTSQLAVTVAATGAPVATFGGQALSGLAAPLAQFALGDPAGAAAVYPNLGGAVSSVNGQSGAVSITPANLGALAAANNLSDVASASTALGNLGGMRQMASTGAAGYTLVNATGNILTYTTPNDGQMHRVMVVGEVKVTSAQTGGAIGLTFTYPDGSTSPTASINAGGSGAGYHGLSNVTFDVAPNTTVTLQQTSAQSAGAAVSWFELWGA